MNDDTGFRSIAPGVEMSVLRAHDGGGSTFLIRMQRGARAPLHDHPGGEETYILSGTLRIQHRRSADGQDLPDVVLPSGAYLHAPPGEVHDGIADEACLFFVVAAGGVRPRSAAVSSR